MNLVIASVQQIFKAREIDKITKGGAGGEHFAQEKASDWGARGSQTMPAYGGGRAAGSSDGFRRAGPAMGECSGRLGPRA